MCPWGAAGRFGFEIPFPGARTHLPLPKVGNLVVLIPDEGRRSGGRRRLQGSVVGLNLSGSRESLEAHPFATQGLFCALTFKKRKSLKKIYKLGHACVQFQTGRLNKVKNESCPFTGRPLVPG